MGVTQISERCTPGRAWSRARRRRRGHRPQYCCPASEINRTEGATTPSDVVNDPIGDEDELDYCKHAASG